jgi:predicted Zn-dependent protease
LHAIDRVRLASVPLLVGFAFSLGGVLAAVFPTRQEYAELADDRAPDAYSLAYLQVLTRANPTDEHLRLIYVRHLSELGRYDEALDALGPAIAAQQDDVETRGVELDLLLARARSIPEDDPRRAEASEGVADQLERLVLVRAPADRLEKRAKLALELERPRLAAEYYVRAAAQAPDEAASLLAEAAKWMRASGDGVGAANGYREASAKEKDPLRSKRDALLAMESLESEDLVPDAANLADAYLRKWPDDRQLLGRAVDLSSRCERVLAARDYGRRLVELEPESEVVLEQQIRLELAAGDVRAAVPLLQRLVARRPDDVRLHQAQARIAEWAGRPDLALGAWLWLLGHGRSQATRGPVFAWSSEAR